MPIEIINDPEGVHNELPTYPWRSAPPGLATRRQLSARGLRPYGSAPVAVLRKPRSALRAYLYREADARPKRPYREGLARSVAAMNAARRRCVRCGTDAGYVVPKQLGYQCVPCYDQHADFRVPAPA